MTSNAEIAKSLYRAFASTNRKAAEQLIAEDFVFTSPLDNHIDRASYFARCWPNSSFLTDFDFIDVVEQGDRVFVNYEAETNTGKCFRNTEILTLRGGQLISAEVYFGWDLPHKAAPGGFIDQDSQ